MSAEAQVALAPLAEADSDALFRWINDRELVSLNAQFRPVERSEHDRWFAEVRDRDDVAIFAIRLSDGDRLIGSCQLNGIDRDAGSAQLQIRIGDRSEWGKGHGTAAVGALLEYAFGELGLRLVSLHAFADNRRAIRVYEKAGFRTERVVPGAATVDGEPKDLVEMVAEGGGPQR